MKILLVEDDKTIIAALTRSLAVYHYIVDAVTDGEVGWTYATTFEYDLIVLDVCLPKLDGLSFCRRFREEGYTAPILFLTAQGNSLDKVRGLDAGADDYVVKPFDIDELSARIRALLRRGSDRPFPHLVWGELVLDPSTCEVTYSDRPLTLTTKEYELLELFLRDGHCVYSAEEILDRLWSSEEFPVESTVRSHLRRLRQKLAAVGAPQDFIATLHGRGYYLKSEESLNRNAALISLPSPEPILKYRPEQEQAYLAFLNETWATTQSESLGQLMALSQALKTGAQSLEFQAQAQHLAHKLAGTLGIFMLTEGIQLARELEVLLDQPIDANASAIAAHLTTLTKLIQSTATIEACQTPTNCSPLLWIATHDPATTQALTSAAACAGMRTAIAETTSQVRAWLQPNLRQTQQPDAILLKLPSPQSLAYPKQAASFDLNILQDLANSYLDCPILVMGSFFELSNRLEIIKRGGKILIDSSITAEAAIAAVKECLSSSSQGTKVMVVDDDQTLLHTLPALLHPWGFKVSTLAAPQQFWSVLEAVKPDALVLDVKMPEMNGLELCQILRSDLRWRQLPILFLSVVSDAQTQQQAFEAGADDYLCKPVAGANLAHRILNRLQRHKAWSG
jgi:DNA-binding response OmpR family regulator/HPt (histidine-containing phosphotransfer) domain-containing protein